VLRVKTSIVTGGRRSSVALAVIVMLSYGLVLRRDPECGMCVIVWSGVHVVIFSTSAPLQCRGVFKNSLSTPCVQRSVTLLDLIISCG